MCKVYLYTQKLNLLYQLLLLYIPTNLIWSHHHLSTHGTDDSQGDAEGQGSQGDSGHIYRPIIYSFAAVGGVLVAATLVLVMAILVVQRKRRQLLAAQLLTQEQKIAIMKQTGYVNPTYKFFDKHNDG